MAGTTVKRETTLGSVMKGGGSVTSTLRLGGGSGLKRGRHPRMGPGGLVSLRGRCEVILEGNAWPVAVVALGAWTVTRMVGSGAAEEEAPPWPPCRRMGTRTGSQETRESWERKDGQRLGVAACQRQESSPADVRGQGSPVAPGWARGGSFHCSSLHCCSVHCSTAAVSTAPVCTAAVSTVAVSTAAVSNAAVSIGPEPLKTQLYSQTKEEGMTYEKFSKIAVDHAGFLQEAQYCHYWKDLQAGKKWKDQTISGNIVGKDNLLVTFEGGLESLTSDQIDYGLEEDSNNHLAQGGDYAAVLPAGEDDREDEAVVEEEEVATEVEEEDPPPRGVVAKWEEYCPLRGRAGPDCCPFERERGEKELLKQAKLKATEEQAMKKKRLEEEMLRFQKEKMMLLEREEEERRAAEEEAAAEEEEEEEEEPLERRRGEERGEVSGTKEEDRWREKKISEWVVNLSFGEDEQAQLYVPQEEREAFARALELIEDPLERQAIEGEKKIEWKLKMMREKKRRSRYYYSSEPLKESDEELDTFIAKLATIKDTVERNLMLEEKRAELNRRLLAARRQEVEDKKRLQAKGDKLQKALEAQKENPSAAEAQLALLREAVLNTRQDMELMRQTLQRVETHRVEFENVWNNFVEKSAKDVDQHVQTYIQALDEHINKVFTPEVVEKIVKGAGGDGGDGDGDDNDDKKSNQGFCFWRAWPKSRSTVPVMATFAEGRNEEALLAELLGDGGDRRAYLIGCRLASDINCCIPAAERNTMYGQLYELMGKYGLAIGLELSHDRSKTAMDLLRKLRKDFSHPHQGNTTVNFTRRGNLRNKEEHGSNENDGNKSVRDGTNVQSSGVDECIRQAHSARISQALGCPEVSPRSQPSKDTYQFVVSQLNFKNRARAYEIFVLGGPECLDGVFRLLLQHKTSDQTSMVATARHLSEWIGARVADMGGVRALELAALMSLAADNKRILSKENCVAEKHGSVNGPGPVWWVHLGFHIVERSALLHQLEYIGGIQSREVSHVFLHRFAKD
ncbi:hypothetical protein CBR_g37336 [Chara braunii]|uniref:Uncharacterized protein n=1 Tax=Chara braunii TaxID=69332 RepID=A0A388JZL4_CHABU|nr:hypothetical protein CBR_g37336 [Chara braunii]|eukprot:GBG63250.1 hypothetical protein CBR_g37336 [Chara braunii]